MKKYLIILFVLSLSNPKEILTISQEVQYFVKFYQNLPGFESVAHSVAPNDILKLIQTLNQAPRLPKNISPEEQSYLLKNFIAMQDSSPHAKSTSSQFISDSDKSPSRSTSPKLSIKDSPSSLHLHTPLRDESEEDMVRTDSFTDTDRPSSQSQPPSFEELQKVIPQFSQLIYEQIPALTPKEFGLQSVEQDHKTRLLFFEPFVMQIAQKTNISVNNILFYLNRYLGAFEDNLSKLLILLKPNQKNLAEIAQYIPKTQNITHLTWSDINYILEKHLRINPSFMLITPEQKDKILTTIKQYLNQQRPNTAKRLSPKIPSILPQTTDDEDMVRGLSEILDA